MARMHLSTDEPCRFLVCKFQFVRSCGISLYRLLLNIRARELIRENVYDAKYVLYRVSLKNAPQRFRLGYFFPASPRYFFNTLLGNF